MPGGCNAIQKQTPAWYPATPSQSSCTQSWTSAHAYARVRVCKKRASVPSCCVMGHGETQPGAGQVSEKYPNFCLATVVRYCPLNRYEQTMLTKLRPWAICAIMLTIASAQLPPIFIPWLVLRSISGGPCLSLAQGLRNRRVSSYQHWLVSC